MKKHSNPRMTTARTRPTVAPFELTDRALTGAVGGEDGVIHAQSIGGGGVATGISGSGK